MTKDLFCGNKLEKCESGSTAEGREPCLCSGESEPGATSAPSNNLIDFKQRTSELRIKGALTGSVSSYDAIRALAFGLMHLNGDGVARDLSKAARFLATAAKGGIAQAQHELAQLHLAGTGVPYDPDFAIRLLQGASDEQYVASTVSLAELYIFGKHCPKDTDKALELLYSASGKNEPAVMYYLALIYDRDAGYRDSFEAAYWYRRAAEYGHFKSQIRLASLYATGQGVPHCAETAEAFLDVALESTPEQDPKYLLWQGERFAGQPETEFLANALIKASAEMQHTPAQRVMLQHGWRA